MSNSVELTITIPQKFGGKTVTHEFSSATLISGVVTFVCDKFDGMEASDFTVAIPGRKIEHLNPSDSVATLTKAHVRNNLKLVSKKRRKF